MRRSWRWLLLGAALLAVAAWLMSMADDEGVLSRELRPDVAFPRQLRPRESKRMIERRSLPAAMETIPAPVVVGAAPENAPAPIVQQRLRDPVLLALPPKSEGKSVLVLEANALLNSPIGELMLTCLGNRGGSGFKDLEQTFGIDPARDIDRVALAGEALVVSGHFKDFAQKLAGKTLETATRIGDAGQLYRQDIAGEDGGEGRSQYLAMWKDSVILVADSKDELTAVIDRMEGRAPPSEPAIPEDETYGDFYGRLTPQDLVDLIPEEQKAFADRILEATTGARVHADAAHDFALVADVDGDDPGRMEELGKSLGAALSVGRMAARAQGNEDLAEVLSYARVSPGGDALKLDMALPLQFFEKHLAACAGRTKEPEKKADP